MDVVHCVGAILFELNIPVRPQFADRHHKKTNIMDIYWVGSVITHYKQYISKKRKKSSIKSMNHAHDPGIPYFVVSLKSELAVNINSNSMHLDVWHAGWRAAIHHKVPVPMR